MLSFMQNLFAPRGNPIGVDFGADCLRMAQVQSMDGDFRLIAAASADVPSHVRQDPQLRLEWFVETARDLLTQGRFRGRQAVLSLPASWMHLQHLRMPKMDEQALKKALPWEARGKLPIDPSTAMLRHLVAGEIYQDQDPKLEVIILAARRELINQYLLAASRARLDVVGMHIEPQVLADCFVHIYRRKTDADVTNCYVDIGCTATRAVIARGRQILFARTIPVGGDEFSRAVAAALGISFEQAKVLRIKVAGVNPMLDEHRRRAGLEQAEAPTPLSADRMEQAFPLLGAALSARGQAPAGAATAQTGTATAVAERIAEPDAPPSADGAELAEQARLVEQASREPLDKLVEELDLCRRYYEATFPNRPVDRLVFVGGEARQRSLCQYVAQRLSLAAQVGDPLVRMARNTDLSLDSGIDRRQPQPAWTVAVGLSMGPADGEDRGR